MTQTTGLGIPAYVTVSGNGIVAVGVDLPISKSTPFAPQTNAFANVGQGHGASANVPVGPFPNAQYSLTLSISGATYNGVTYPSSTIAVAALLDAANNAFVGEGTIF